MKKIIKLSFAIMAITLMSTGVSKAAFPIKQEVAASQVVVNNQSELSTTGTTVVNTKAELQKQSADTKKESSKSKGISKGLYIVLAIFSLGWLGMGINDNFEGYDWLISLVLYCLFWLPGFIYTLIKMKKYY